MITLSNGHKFEWMVASGALGFDGKGWFWEKPLVWLGLVKPELFTIVLKTLTRHPRRGNLSWWRLWTWLPFSPWSCVRFLPGGAVNKVGLTNPGIEYWCKHIGPRLNFEKYALVASIFGDEKELVLMAGALNNFKFKALEVNVSCPNADHDSQTETVIQCLKAVKRASRYPVIAKLSVDQDYIKIAERLTWYADAISLNSVPWNVVFTHGEKTPLSKLEKKVGGGGGGVSGKPAQDPNWHAVKYLSISRPGYIPVIAPSVMSIEDVQHVKSLGANAVSFGTIHLRTPWKPTQIVEDLQCRK